MTTQSHRRSRPFDPDIALPARAPAARPDAAVRRWTPTAYALAGALTLAVAGLIERLTGVNLVPDLLTLVVLIGVLGWTLALWLVSA